MNALDLPEGHYAIVDPHNPDTITYWRRKNARRGNRKSFGTWPPGTPLPRENVLGYLAAVTERIAADPTAAQKRFAEFTSRCCMCGRALTDQRSKVYGIGPECRSEIPETALAKYFTPAVGRAHAEHLTRARALRDVA